MALDKALTLVQNKRQNAPKDPIVARRLRLINRIKNQIDLCERDLRLEPTQRIVRRLVKWWWQEGPNWFLSIQYCRRPLELAKGKWSIQCDGLEGIAQGLRSVEKAIFAGEFDAQMMQNAERTRANFKPRKAS